MRYASLFRRLFFGAVLLGSVNQASAAEVRGRLLLGPYQPPVEQAPRAGFHWELDNGFKETLQDRVPADREIAVVLTSEDGDKTTAERKVVLSGGSLLPSTLVVNQGTTVSIQNQDEVAHEVYAVGLEGFGAEAISPGGHRAINLTKVGDWPLRDQLVPHARGHLHVRNDVVAIGVVSDNGAFVFEDAPVGSFTLRVFHNGAQIATQPVEVTAKPVTLDPITPTSENKQSK